MRGTGYAVVEIIFWMPAAAVVGAIIGWLLCSWWARRRTAGEWGARLESARERASELEAKVEELSAALGHRPDGQPGGPGG